jgi:hypothetical protein
MPGSGSVKIRRRHPWPVQKNFRVNKMGGEDRQGDWKIQQEMWNSAPKE